MPGDTPRRADVYWVDLNPVVGSEQGGRRPAVVVSPDSMNRSLPTVVILPITSRIKERFSGIAPILPAGDPLEKESCVLTFQPRTIDKKRMVGFVATLSPSQMAAVAMGVIKSFGLRLGPVLPATSEENPGSSRT